MTREEAREFCRRCSEAVTAEEAARYYGLDINRHSKACCPFHADDKPSLSFKDGRFHCFGCGAHGDSVSYVSLYFGLKPFEAVRKLDADFGLHLPLDRPQTAQEAAEARERARQRDIIAQFKDWREETLKALCEAVRCGNLALKQERELTDAEADAVYYKDRLEYWLEKLESEDAAEQMEIFRIKEEVMAVCQRIIQNISKRLEIA